jgi:hypothetical protein
VSGTAADVANSSIANKLWVEPSPVIPGVNAPSFAPSSSSSFASAGGTIGIAQGVGSSSLQSDLPRGLVAVSSPANPSVPASFPMLVGTGVSGQSIITLSLHKEGEVLLVNAFSPTIGAIHTPVVIGSNPGDPTTQESPVALAIATSGTSSLLTTANSSNVATLVGISTVSLVSFGTSKVSGNAGRLLAMNSTSIFAGRLLATMPPYRDVADVGNGGTVARAEAAPQCLVTKSGLFGVAVPSPQRSDLIMDLRPFDQAAVEQTIDQFLQQFKDLGAGLCWLNGPTDVVVELVAVAVALTAWKVVPKILGRSPNDDELATVDVATCLDGISGLPGGSSPEEP